MNADEKKALTHLLAKAKNLDKSSSWVCYCMLSADTRFTKQAFLAMAKYFKYKENWALIKYTEYIAELNKRQKEADKFRKGLDQAAADKDADELAEALNGISQEEVDIITPGSPDDDDNI